ncbi:TSUP family transporter [Rhodobacterales bacterium HKCCE3408]|nr:TSUP family transporter [Rhodobacterales bacterium HKCCE3408]
MPDGLTAALALPGLPLVVLVSFVAGVVYGFAGFGSALIFMPVAARVLPPEMAIGAFSLSALASLFTVVPGAWAVADRRAVLQMLIAALIATPLGIWLLRVADPEPIRTAMSVIVLVTLAALIAGWRFPVAPGWRARSGIGALAGLSGGATGLNGPAVILFNMGQGVAASAVRANSAVFLTISSLTFVPQLWLQGLVDGATVWLGIGLLLPYAAGTALGTRAFRPGRERIYRGTAYIIIAAAGLLGLPIWR